MHVPPQGVVPGAHWPGGVVVDVSGPVPGVPPSEEDPAVTPPQATREGAKEKRRKKKERWKRMVRQYGSLYR